MNDEKSEILKTVTKDRRILWMFVVLMLANVLLIAIMAIDEPDKKLRLLGPGLMAVSMGCFVYSTKSRITKTMSRYKSLG